ncbi:MAG: biopolymer transporter ExbD [Bacteroidia bacterium]|nr:biopolymer transporter ExbD [Bacteroidia bacterium]
MAEIIQEDSGHKKGGKRRPKKHSTHIDMTPMVDLMCLLITFFMLTTAFSKPKVMEIVMPEKKQDKDIAPVVEAKRTMNILLTDSSRIYYYIGIADPNKLPLPDLIKSDFSKDGIRKVLLEKNKKLFLSIDSLKQKVLKGEVNIPKDSIDGAIKKMKNADHSGPIVLIKSNDRSKYKNIVDIIDEMAICNIARYAIVDLSKTETKMLDSAPR